MSDLRAAFAFLKDLEENNHREWFHANKNQYEKAKAAVLDFGRAVLSELAQADVSLQSLEIKNCLFRINRDIRFSKDKSPYKNHFGLNFVAGGKKSLLAGYYLHLSPSETFIACGNYLPETTILKGIREEIDYCFAEWEEILQDARFIESFGKELAYSSEMKLSRPPKGYTVDNPAIDYLKYKGFVVVKSYKEEEVYSPVFSEDVVARLTSGTRFIQFLNRPFESSVD